MLPGLLSGRPFERLRRAKRTDQKYRGLLSAAKKRSVLYTTQPSSRKYLDSPPMIKALQSYRNLYNILYSILSKVKALAKLRHRRSCLNLFAGGMVLQAFAKSVAISKLTLNYSIQEVSISWR